MNLPKISVITPSYNQGQFIEETLQSIYEQNYPNLEHIIIDGGSTDNTLEVIQKYDGKIAYWVSEPDKGQTDALIKGFNRATGDILCWLNSDDVFLSDTLWKVVDYFVNNPKVEIAFGDALWMDENGIFIKNKIEIPFNWFIWLYNYNYIPQPSCFWKHELYQRVGGLDGSFSLAMDADFWARCACVTTIHHVDQIWSKMRFYPEQRNQRFRELSNTEDQRIRDRYIKQQPDGVLFLKKYLAKSLRMIWQATMKMKIYGKN